MTTICAIDLRIILDSRGRKTVEAEVRTEHGSGRAAAPGGVSTGRYEASVKDPIQAITYAREQVIPHLIGLDARDQIGIDGLLTEIDGTGTFAQIGSNLSVVVSLATAKAAADAKDIPLWQHLCGVFVSEIPLPLGNVIGGGEHGSHATEIQEFLVAPTGAQSISEAVFANARVHAVVKELLQKKSISCGKGDEGGWVPSLSDIDKFEIMIEALSLVSDEVEFPINLGIDMAASQFWDQSLGSYHYIDGVTRTTDEQISHVCDLIDEYSLIYVEDPIQEDDFGGFESLTREVGNRSLICGDDLFVTNPERIQDGITKNAANCVLIKPDQIGTLTKTYESVRLAHKYGLETVMSHRSGETEDTTIAHLGCAFDCIFLKTGVVGGERTAKLNELIRIEESMHERK